MSALYSLRCNGCGSERPATSDTSLARARQLAQSIGWTHPKPGQDFCKECSERRTDRESKENPSDYL